MERVSERLTLAEKIKNEESLEKQQKLEKVQLLRKLNDDDRAAKAKDRNRNQQIQSFSTIQPDGDILSKVFAPKVNRAREAFARNEKIS